MGSILAPATTVSRSVWGECDDSVKESFHGRRGPSARPGQSAREPAATFENPGKKGDSGSVGPSRTRDPAFLA